MVIFGQKLRKIQFMKLCSVRKCWKAKILGVGRFTPEIDFRIDSRSKFRKGRRLSLGGLV